jgi:predicted N-acetyltransferase YhbS
MSDSPVIRRARLQEAGKMSGLALRSKAHWGYPREFLDACEAELTVDPARFSADEFEYFVCCDEGSILGFYALEKLSADDYELDALFVEPAVIGTGIGRLLIRHAIATATKHGAARVIIQGDPNATEFYVAAGARRTGRRESASIPGRFLPVFEIKIE